MESNDYMVMALAEAIHRGMCWRGKTTPMCVSDRGDAILMAEELKAKGWRLTRIETEES